MKPLLALALTGLLTACASFSPARAPRSIVQLASADGTCTAWAVAPFRWLSAAHCFAADPGGWHIAGGPVTLLALDVSSDLALLKGPQGEPLPVATAPPPIGATVHTYGYGLGKPVLLVFTGLLVSPEAPFFDGGERLMLLSGMNGMPGMSGGVVLWHGHVVGQITGGGPAPSHAHLLGTAVPLAALRRFLRLHLDR